MREAADLFLSLGITDNKKYNKLIKAGVDPEDVDNQMAVVVGLTEKAQKGDPKAAKVLMDMIGEEPVIEETADDGFLDALKGEAADVWQE